MSGVYGVSQEGQLRFGCFYSLVFQHTDVMGPPKWLMEGMLSADHPHPPAEDAFIVVIADDHEDSVEEVQGDSKGRQNAAEDFYWSNELEEKLCCSNSSHNSWIRRRPIRLKVWENNRHDFLEKAGLRENVKPYVAKHLLLQLESFGDGPRFSSRALAEKINAVGLSGLRFETTSIKEVVDSCNAAIVPSFDTDVVEWLFVGEPCDRPAAIRHAQNACPFCGFGPIVCDVCGHLQNDCPSCGDYIFKPNEAGKPGLEMLPSPESRKIIAGCLWDGSDAICGRRNTVGFVTRRFVDFLLAVEAAPFYATPVAVCVDGMSKEQLRWLDQALDVGSLRR